MKEALDFSLRVQTPCINDLSHGTCPGMGCGRGGTLAHSLSQASEDLGRLSVLLSSRKDP